MAHKKSESDVLIVGGGGAAVMSAVVAGAENVSVNVVSKGKIGRSGNLIMLGGSFGVDGPGAKEYCGEAEANPNYTKDNLFKKTVACAFQLGNQKLQKQFVEEGPKAVGELLKWVKAANEKFIFLPKACRWRASGVGFGRSLIYGLKEAKKDRPINVFEDVFVCDLIKKNDKVCGAIGIDVYSGDIIEFKAKAVILATGGYQPFSLKNTCSDMTGDGIAMALRAGAQITDMEFLLFIPTIVEPAYAKGSLIPFIMTMPHLFPLRQKAVDLDGEELFYPADERYKLSPENSKVEKLLLHYFYGQELFKKWERNGNRFYFDYSHHSDEEIRAAFDTFAGNFAHWYKRGKYHALDLIELGEHIIKNNKRLLVGLGNEYSMGGVIVDENFSTGVPGLFAAGEVTSGVFGAFRSGDGLTEMLAHGLTAGKTAAEYAKTAELADSEQVEEKITNFLAPLTNADGFSPIKLLDKLESACDKGYDIFRDEKGLQTAYNEICAIETQLDKLTAPGGKKYNLELLNSVALRNLVLCAKAGIQAAIQRKESRGCHMRSDYPEVNNKEYLYSITASLDEQGELKYGKKYPDPVHIALSQKNYPNLAECIAETILEAK